jgi:hypothetical protein
MSRRSGVFKALEERLRTGLYGSEEEAVAALQERKRRRGTVELDLFEMPAEGEKL